MYQRVYPEISIDLLITIPQRLDESHQTSNHDTCLRATAPWDHEPTGVYQPGKMR